MFKKNLEDRKFIFFNDIFLSFMKKILEINMTVDIFVDIILPPNIMSYFCNGCSIYVYRRHKKPRRRGNNSLHFLKPSLGGGDFMQIFCLFTPEKRNCPNLRCLEGRRGYCPLRTKCIKYKVKMYKANC